MKQIQLWIVFLAIIFFFLIPSSTFAADVVINEFLPNPSGPTSENAEWIELYNTASSTIDLSNWQIDDILDSGTLPYTIPSGTTINQNSFLVFEKSITKIGLNNTGDTVRLINSSGSEIDLYSYSSTTEDVSYGRSTDGGSTWISFSSPTKNTTNGSPMPTSTPTPSPAPSATNTPTPTKTPMPTPIRTPTPTKTPTPIKTPTPTPVKTPTPTPTPTSKPKSNLPSPTPTPRNQSSAPTSVLGEKTKINTPTPTISSKPQEFAQNNLAKILIGLGVVFIGACGILAFRAYRNNFKNENL